MKTLTLNAWGKDHQVFFRTSTYAANDNLYVGLMFIGTDGYGEPWSDLTVNLGMKCAENCAYIDINNNALSIIPWLVVNNFGNVTGNFRSSGFCDYPEFRFNMDKLKEYMEG